MIDFTRVTSFFLFRGPTDLRKGIDGYCSLVSGVMALDPFSPSLFLFCNRNKDKLKVLYWDGNGFWLLYKRLEEGKFRWPKNGEGTSLSLSNQQLKWLMEGLDINQKRAFQPLTNRVV